MQGQKKSRKTTTYYLLLRHPSNMGRASTTYSKGTAKAKGLQPLTNFFQVRSKPRKPGRPKKIRAEEGANKGCVAHSSENKRKRGRPKKDRTEEQQPQLKHPLPAVSYEDDRKPAASTKRTNWSLPENLEKLKDAVERWDAQGKETFDGNKKMSISKSISKRSYAIAVDIPYGTLQHYIHDDLSKRRELGVSVGRKSHLDNEDDRFVANVLIRADRGNDGMDRRDAVDLITDIVPTLSVKQATNVLDRTFKKKHAGVDLKKHMVRAQKTTTKRSAITVEQQFRWFTTYEAALEFLRVSNTGLCKVSGVAFGELIQHFIVGGDESCIIASDGTTKIFGSIDRRKHEKKLEDSRASVTMYRTGNVAGSTGPTFFLLAGKKCRHGYNDQFLKRNGAATGSSIVMTENAFMTDDAWKQMSPLVSSGIRGMPVVRDNPQWWVLEVFDGFGSHTSGYEAMKVRSDSKILCLKEEGDSSHVNQAYDKYVARSDKAASRQSLSYLRKAKQVNKGVIDQWQLIHAGLYAVRNTTPETWTNSFRACNMDPRVKIAFPAWCEKIKDTLQAGDTFKKEKIESDPYILLPSMWHGMEPAEKQSAMEVLKEHGYSYSATCVKALHKKCNIPFKDMQTFRMCLALAQKHPSHLERGAPTDAEIVEQLEPTSAVKEAYGAHKDINDGLIDFQLKPVNLTGEDLFLHMVQFRQRMIPRYQHRISAYLAISPRGKIQKSLQSPEMLDIVKGDVMKDIGSSGPGAKISRRKLDALSYVKSQSGLVNNPERLKRLKDQLELAGSIEDILASQEELETAKKQKLHEDMQNVVVAAEQKLNDKTGDVSKLTKMEIASILCIRFKKEVTPSKHKKDELVKTLQEAIALTVSPV